MEEETKISDILSKCERILQNVENEDSDELCVGPVDKQVLAQLVKQQFRIKKQYTLPAYRVLSAECEDPVRCLSINSLGSIILADQSNNLQVIFPKQGAKRDKSKHGDVLAMKWLSLSKFLVAYSSGTIILYNRALKQLLSVDTAMSDVLLSRINILDVDSPSTLVECISQNSFKSVFYHKLTFTEFSSNILLQDRCFHSSHRFLELLKFERESTDCVSSQKLCRNPLRGMFLVGLTASKKKIIKIDMAIEEEGNIYECRQELIHHILVDEHKTSLLMQNSILMLCEKTAGVYSLKRLSLNGETLKQYSLNMQGTRKMTQGNS